MKYLIVSITLLFCSITAIAGEILSMSEVCLALDTSEHTIIRWVNNGLLTNIGSEEEYKFDEEEVNRFLDFQKRLG